MSLAPFFSRKSSFKKKTPPGAFSAETSTVDYGWGCVDFHEVEKAFWCCSFRSTSDGACATYRPRFRCAGLQQQMYHRPWNWSSPGKNDPTVRESRATIDQAGRMLRHNRKIQPIFTVSILGKWSNGTVQENREENPHDYHGQINETLPENGRYSGRSR